MIKNFFEESVAAKVIAGILGFVVLLVGLFFMYKSPVKYVLTKEGDVYHDENGQTIVYHTDLFGNTFIYDRGIRVYVSVPTYMDS